MRFCVGDAATTCRAAEATTRRHNSGNISTQQWARAEDHVDFIQPTEIQQEDLPQELFTLGGVAETTSAETAAEVTEAEEPVTAPDDMATEVEVELPFCFMTLALNAMPFITHHAPTFDEVGQILSMRAASAAAAAAASTTPNSKTSSEPAKNHHPSGGDNNPDFDFVREAAPPLAPPPESFWEWHIVEGVAVGRANHGDPYSRRRIPERYFDPATGLSVDGTAEYLDDVVAGDVSVDFCSSPPPWQQRVHVHRRCGGGKHLGKGRKPGGGAGPAESFSTDRSTTNSTGIPAATAGMTAGRKRGKHRSHRRGEGLRDGGDGGDSGDGGDGGDGGGSCGAPRSSCLWRDKIQMINSVAFSLEKECLLVQIDADELWTAEQLVRLRDMFLLERNGSGDDGTNTSTAARGGVGQQPGASGLGSGGASVEGERSQSPADAVRKGGDNGEGVLGSDRDRQLQPQQPTKQQQNHEHQDNPDKTAKKRECAYFDCHFFVGPDLVTVTEDGWGHSATNEWLRAWVFRPRESVWLQHAPPELARHDEAAGWELLAGDQCIGRQETRERGLVFTHYAYVLEDQVGGWLFLGHGRPNSRSSWVTKKTPSNPLLLCTRRPCLSVVTSCKPVNSGLLQRWVVEHVE